MGQTIARTRRFARKWTRPRRPRLPWASSFYENTTIAIDTTITELVPWTYDDFEYSTAGVNFSGPHKLHRLEFRGGMSVTPQSTNYSVTSGALAIALYMADAEDSTDINIWDVANNVFVNHQVLWYRVFPASYFEVPSAQASDLNTKIIPVTFDLKFRKPMRFPRDTDIRLNFQWSATMGATVGGASLWAISRAIVQPAQMGR